ncbi:MAG: LuxR C-terminal-related transcriptional regulator, partial [Longimicrobiales bacterium]
RLRERGLKVSGTKAQLVARLVAQGLSNKAIGRELDCATRTVSTHLSNIYTKLDIGGPGARMRLSNLVAEAGPAE